MTKVLNRSKYFMLVQETRQRNKKKDKVFFRVGFTPEWRWTFKEEHHTKASALIDPGRNKASDGKSWRFRSKKAAMAAYTVLVMSF